MRNNVDCKSHTLEWQVLLYVNSVQWLWFSDKFTRITELLELIEGEIFCQSRRSAVELREMSELTPRNPVMSALIRIVHLSGKEKDFQWIEYLVWRKVFLLPLLTSTLYCSLLCARWGRRAPIITPGLPLYFPSKKCDKISSIGLGRKFYFTHVSLKLLLWFVLFQKRILLSTTQAYTRPLSKHCDSLENCATIFSRILLCKSFQI